VNKAIFTGFGAMQSVRCRQCCEATNMERVGPTFLGIGSARCGSTWLYQALKQHPDICISTPKQIQFFNKCILTHGAAWYYDHFKREGAAVAPVRGEITPFYSRLSESSVACVHRFLPDVRIVLTIRNPLDRIWSHLLYDWGVYKRKNLSQMSTIGLMNYLQRRRTIRYTDYEVILRRWRRYYGEEAVHVDLFGRIRQDAEGFLHDVLAHIGADPLAHLGSAEELKKPVLASEDLLSCKIEAPAAIRWALAVQWLPRMRSLNDYLKGRVEHWIREMEIAAYNSRPSWRVMRNASRFVTSLPERVAYAAYDVKTEMALQQRWRMVSDEVID